MSQTTGSILSQDWYSEVPRSTRLPTILGLFVLLVGGGIFAAWATIAPIAGAVVTSGMFVTTGQNKIIQHLEGGVIGEILVREGDIVKPGQVLIRLDQTAPEAELRRLVLREARLSAMENRLEAEIRDLPATVFGPDLLARAEADPDIAALLEGQHLTFDARRENLESRTATVQRGIDALRAQVNGLEVQLASVRDQLAIIEEERAAKQELFEAGLVRKTEVMALERAKASLEGEIGRITGQIGDAQERIARAEQEIVSIRNAAIQDSVEELHAVTAELTDVRERIRSAENILERINITAPVEGVVVRLAYHTPGGVIEAGKSIMEIVPIQDELIIEARVRPQDIDNVKMGQAASVRLTALSQRTTPMVGGEVVYVSADALPDDKPSSMGADVYVARIRLDPDEAAAIEDFVPTAGMPAEVYIKTSERSFFQYLMQPIRDTMARAFRET